MAIQDLNAQVAISSPFKRAVGTWIRTHGDHFAVPKQASRFATFGQPRVKIACISWNLASLLILNTFCLLLSSSFWKAENFSTDAVKEYNICKKDITLLIVLISSDYFEQNERLLSKETDVSHQWGGETLNFCIKQLHKGQISTTTK